MALELDCLPHRTFDWTAFCESIPPRSIGVDGLVVDTDVALNGTHLAVDHHGPGQRNRAATCELILQIIRHQLGDITLDPFTTPDGDLDAILRVNHPDEDVCTTWYLLRHLDSARRPEGRALDEFVRAEGRLDATAGTFPTPLKTLGKLAWVFDPYNTFKAEGGLDRGDPWEYSQVIVAVEERIEEHIRGEGKELPLDLRYQLLGSSNGISLIEPTGKHSKYGVVSDGHRMFVEVRQRGNDLWTYTIVDATDGGNLRLLALYPYLNILEQERYVVGMKVFPLDRWGGGDAVGGSPRQSGSRINPRELLHHINLFRNSVNLAPHT